MAKYWKISLLICVLAVVFFTSGYLANYLLSVTGCVYTSGGLFSVTFLGLGAGVISLLNWFIDFHNLI